jgi:hypothetical protein
MREYRRRLRDDLRLYTFEIGKPVLAALEQLGLLEPGRRDDTDAIQTAIYALCQVGYQAKTAAEIELMDLPDWAVEALVTHGFLPSAQRQDRAAIRDAVAQLARTFSQAATKWDLSAIWAPSRTA